MNAIPKIPPNLYKNASPKRGALHKEMLKSQIDSEILR